MHVTVTVAAPDGSEQELTLTVPVGPATIRVGAVRVLNAEDMGTWNGTGWTPPS